MKLRSELFPPPIDAQKLETLSHLMDEILGLMDVGENYDLHLKLFNKLAARPYSIGDLDGALGAMSSAEFAKFALTPEPPYIANLTHEEQLELIRRVGYSEYGEYEDHELSYWAELLRKNLGVPQLICPVDKTPEQALQQALSHKTIQL